MKIRKDFYLIIAAMLMVASNADAHRAMHKSMGEDNPDAVVTNGFWNNWELSAALQGLSFYSNEENAMESSASPFQRFREKLGLSLTATKWFSPEIALRTKVSGIWAKTVRSFDEEVNASRYIHLQEQAMVSVPAIVLGYDAQRKWDAMPYLSVGWTRNYTYDKKSLTFSIGAMASYRIKERLKFYADLSGTLVGDDFDSYHCYCSNIISNRDRWITAEIGVTYLLGRRSWRKITDIIEESKALEDANRERLNEAISRIDTLQKRVDSLSNTKETIIENPSEISVFFIVGTAKIENQGQVENLKAIATYAKEHDTMLTVTGYADSETGNAEENILLSALRAEAVKNILTRMGVEAEHIKTVAAGGVNIISPYPANRRALVTIDK